MKCRSSAGGRTILGRLDPLAALMMRPTVSIVKVVCSIHTTIKSAPALAKRVAIDDTENSITKVPIKTSPLRKVDFMSVTSVFPISHAEMARISVLSKLAY